MFYEDKMPYNRVFIPFTDVYSLGGAATFDSLVRDGRNAVVMHYAFIKTLSQLADQGDIKAGAAVRLVKEITETSKRETLEERIHCYRYNDSLDLILIDREKGDTREKISITDFVEKVRKVLNADESRTGVTLVTNVPRYHIKYGGMRGIQIEESSFLQVNESIVQEGIIEGSDELLASLVSSSNQTLSLREANAYLDRNLRINQFLRFPSASQTTYARVHGTVVRERSGHRILRIDEPMVSLLQQHEYGKKVHLGSHVMDEVLGIKPRDMEQYLALQYGLLNHDIALFFLCGSQGSGKTLLSYAAAVDLVLWYEDAYKQKRGVPRGKPSFFKKIVLLRSNDLMGGDHRDIGFLPGSMYHKIKPFLGSYIDAHEESLLATELPFEEMLTNPNHRGDFDHARPKDITNKKIGGYATLPRTNEVIQLTYSAYLRGRSIPNALILIDEAQNYEPHELRAIIERSGEGSKVVVMGDPQQVDNIRCTRRRNGLTSAIAHYLDQPYCALVSLGCNYRSQMSDDARKWEL